MYYKDLADRSFAQLDENDFHYTPDADCNSIAVIIRHMNGNMMSRWTDFLTSDGEKEWRTRDEEFEEKQQSNDALLKLWEAGWACLTHALSSLTAADLSKTVYIRQEPLTVVDAINRQLAHYPYHVGQIVYLAKMIKKGSFKSLSIEKKR